MTITKRNRVGEVRDHTASIRRLTWSMMDKWLRCKRMWYYRYVGQVDTPPSMPLLFGTLMHDLFQQEMTLNRMYQQAGEAVWNTEIARRQNAPDAYVEMRLKDIETVVDTWLDAALVPFQSTEERRLSDAVKGVVSYTEEEARQHAGLATEMFKVWLRLHGSSDLERYRVLAVEPQFVNVQLVKPDLRPHRGWRQGGRVDAVLEDIQTGSVFIREYKTTSLSDAREMEKRVALDPQVRLYADILSRVLSDLLQGRPIEQVQYAVLRKQLPRVPNLVNCKRCRGSGSITKKSFKEEETSVLSQSETEVWSDAKPTDRFTCPVCRGRQRVPSTDKRIDTTEDTLRSFLLENNHRLGPFQDLLPNLHPWERYVNLSTHWLTDDDRTEARTESSRVAKEITRSVRRYQTDNGETPHLELLGECFPRNTSWCSGPGGWCSYREVCQTRQRAEDLKDRLGWVHAPDSPELVNPDTEGS